MKDDMIQQQIQSIQRDLDARRFRGEDPIIPVPAGDRREAIIAKVLAAQSLHAVLGLDGERFNPDEESAEKRMFAGQRLLDYWRVRDEAAKRARRPELQQRITLFRLFADYLREIVLTDFEASLPTRVKTALLDPLSRFDRLSPEETAHYREEAERLWTLRDTMKTDPYLQTVWLTVQARIAMDSSDSAQGMTWLLAASHLNRDRFQPNAYLQELLDRARRRILRLIGEEHLAGSEEQESPAEARTGERQPAGDAGKKTDTEDRVRPRELYDALLIALETAYGDDPRAAMGLFRVKRYIESGDEE
jgi:hypothetical protein